MDDLRAAQRARHATACLFFLSGFCYATWGVDIPQIAVRWALTPASLTILMLAVAVGAILSMGPTGRWAGRVGSRLPCVVGAMLVATAMLCLPHLESWPALLTCLLMFGAGNGIFDTSMNAQAVSVERALGRSVLSSMHGMFSVGGMAGAGLGVCAAKGAWSEATVFTLVGTLTSITVWSLRHTLCSDAPAPASIGRRRAVRNMGALPDKARPHLYRLGWLAFCGLMIEGTMYDWSAAYVRQALNATPWWGAMAYASFSLGMTSGRFMGDAARMRWGDARVLSICSGLAMCGLLVLSTARPVWCVVFGLSIVGWGVSNAVPILFAAGAKATPGRSAEGIASVSRTAYAGFLLGPVAYGLLSEVIGMRLGWGLSVAAALWLTWRAPAGMSISRESDCGRESHY